ncbi:MAG: T9SS type A sorting domain-containing protein, partial [Bacteroidota bacterium]
GESTVMSPSEADPNVYEATIEIESDSTFGYKFWTTADHWEDDPNRSYTTTTEATQVLPVATFNKSVENICGADLETLLVEFAVSMETQIRSGDFDPETDVVVVAGSFNGWNAGATPLDQDPFTPNIYSAIVEIEEFAIPSDIEFKFVTGEADGEIGGWEGRANRILEVTGDEERDDQGRLLLALDPIPYFNDASPDLLFSQDVTLTIVVDARPAYYFLADSSFVPSDVQTSEEVPSFSNVFINGPISNVDGAGDWYAWGPNNLGLLETRMFEPSETFDEDSTFVWTRTFNENQIRRWVGKLGLDGYDNENGFGADHILIIPDEPEVTIELIFGAASGDELRVDLYEPYIGIDESGIPFVQRRPEAVSVEPVDVLPTGITLDQNYPNPFNPSTTFEYTLDKAQHVSVKVFDMLGREVATLVDEVQSVNTYRVTFDASHLASGTYLYQLQTGNQVITRSMTLLK